MTEPMVAGHAPAVLELEPGKYAWCACGMSKNQPFCDGSHKGTGLAPVLFTLSEKKKVALCLCKHTHGAPYCDGTHRTLPKE